MNCLIPVDFCEISYLTFLLKFVDIFRFWFKLKKKILTWRCMYIHGLMSYLFSIIETDHFLWSITLSQKRGCYNKLFQCDIEAEVEEKLSTEQGAFWVINLPAYAVSLMVDFRCVTKIQRHFIVSVEILAILGEVFTNLTSRDNNPVNVPEVLCSANILWHVIIIPCVFLAENTGFNICYIQYPNYLCCRRVTISQIGASSVWMQKEPQHFSTVLCTNWATTSLEISRLAWHCKVCFVVECWCKFLTGSLLLDGLPESCRVWPHPQCHNWKQELWVDVPGGGLHYRTLACPDI